MILTVQQLAERWHVSDDTIIRMCQRGDWKLTPSSNSGKITSMKETRTIKIRLSTYRRIKVAAAELGLTLMDFIDALVAESDTKRSAKRADDTHKSTDMGLDPESIAALIGKR
jgi:hypothetical protein